MNRLLEKISSLLDESKKEIGFGHTYSPDKKLFHIPNLNLDISLLEK